MRKSQKSFDATGAILARHGSPAVATLFDDLTGTYLRLADLFNLNDSGLSVAPPDRPMGAATDLHSDLATLAATWGDLNCTREHLLTATRFTSGADDLGAMAHVDQNLSPQVPHTDCVYAVYDLAAGTLTYDFLHYLMQAEQFRLRAGKSRLFVMFARAPGNGFRLSSNLDHFLSHVRKRWRFANLLIPCAQLLPSCIGVRVWHDRPALAALLRELPPECVFPANFDIDKPICPYGMPEVLQYAGKPHDVRALQAPPLAAALTRRWLGELAGTKPVISITLRESDYQPIRNSNLEAWRGFARWCAAQGFHVVVIPDTEALLSGRAAAFEDGTMLPLAALSVAYRMAVYQESFVNMMVGNGPAGLCLYHPAARSLLFNMLHPSLHICTAEYLASQGMAPGRQIACAGPYQRIVWESDNEDALRRALTSLVAAVLSGPEITPSAAFG